MTPETLVVDRLFRGVGRIKRKTGTTNPTVRRRMLRMLDALFEDGRLDVLRAIRDGGVTLMEVYDAYQRKTLDQIATGATARGLNAAFGAWLESLSVPDDYSDDHVRSLGASRKVLASISGTVADLPATLERLRLTVGRVHPRTFNLARAAALAFVRSTLKRHHPLWLAVAAVEPRKVTAKRKANPLTPAQLRAWFPAPERDALDAITWTMATTGMHAKEYWGVWHLRADRIDVLGTKRKGRVRAVPLVRQPSTPSMHRRTWEDKLRERTARGIVPYDLRRTFAHWMESAGIPRTRRRLYLGHGASDVTDLYEIHEVAAFLADDAVKLRAFLGLSEPSAPLIRLAK